MSIDVSELMTDPDFAVTFTRKRPGTPTLADEGVSSVTYTEEELVGIVQPAPADVVQLMPEGMRVKELRAFYTRCRLSPGDAGKTLPDVLVTADGASYKVVRVEDWSQHGYFMAVGEGFVP